MYEEKLQAPNKSRQSDDEHHEGRPIEEILAELLAQYQPLCGSLRVGDASPPVPLGRHG